MTLTTLAESFGVTEAGLMAGSTPAARRATANRKAIAEAAQILGQAWSGNTMASLIAHEALSSSDLFKSAAGDVLDRDMLAQYNEQPVQWGKFAARTTLKDFKPKYLRELAGGRGRFERVPELSEYPSADYTIGERSIRVEKYGRRFGYSFEAKVNDELGELQQVPGNFAIGARATEDYVALSRLVNPLTGAPNTAFFNAQNENLGSGVLTHARLQAAIVTLSTKRDPDGGGLLTPGPLQLVVGPALAFTAQVLLAQQELRTTTDGTQFVGPNPLQGRVTLTVLENLPGTAWFVLPTAQAPRPAFYVGFLRGWETPDLRYKNDQGRRAGGGDIAPDEGDFDVDAVYWRARHIVGAAHGDPKFTYASDGVGA